VAGSTTGVPMSPGYDGCQTATLPICYTRTTYAMTGYYTKAPEYYTTRYAALTPRLDRRWVRTTSVTSLSSRLL
jgi:hypothetical protein